MDSLMLALRVIVALAVVVALVWYLARRFGHRSQASREAELRVLDRQSLSRHSGVAIVAAGDRRLLVGFSDQSVALVTELAPVPALPKVTSSEVPLASPALPALAPRAPLAGASAGSTPPNRRPGMLAGSVLSPTTWQATVRAMQDRTVRR